MRSTRRPRARSSRSTASVRGKSPSTPAPQRCRRGRLRTAPHRHATTVAGRCTRDRVRHVSRGAVRRSTFARKGLVTGTWGTCARTEAVERLLRARGRRATPQLEASGRRTWLGSRSVAGDRERWSSGKARGLGNIPILSTYAPTHEAAGSGDWSSPRAVTSRSDWHQPIRRVDANSGRCSGTSVPAIPARGPRSARSAGTSVPGCSSWHGSSPTASSRGCRTRRTFTTTSYFRLTLPGLAALVLLLPAIGFLWPGTRPMRSPLNPVELWTARAKSPLLVVATLVAFLPLVVVLIERPAPRSPARLARYTVGSDGGAHFRVVAPPDPQTARRRAPLLDESRTRQTGAKLPSASSDRETTDGCVLLPKGAGECLLSGRIEQWTENVSITDRPGQRALLLPHCAVADNRGNPESVDVVLVGPAVSVRL